MNTSTASSILPKDTSVGGTTSLEISKCPSLPPESQLSYLLSFHKNPDEFCPKGGNKGINKAPFLENLTSSFYGSHADSGNQLGTFLS